MWHYVAVVRTDVSEERIATIIEAKRISELGTTLVTDSVVPSSLVRSTLLLEAIPSSETLVLTKTVWRHIKEDGKFQ
jgi:hypothetical protein